MKDKSVFVGAIRSLEFPSSDAARDWIRKSPLVGDYVLDLLLARQEMILLPDGRIVPSRKISATSGGWPPNWPDREALLSAITPEGLTMAQLKSPLLAAGQPCNHWLLVHSLRRLLNEGAVLKVGLTYRRAGVLAPEAAVAEPAPKPKPAAREPSVSFLDQAIINATAALGPDWTVADIEEFLGRMTEPIRGAPGAIEREVNRLREGGFI